MQIYQFQKSEFTQESDYSIQNDQMITSFNFTHHILTIRNNGMAKNLNSAEIQNTSTKLVHILGILHAYNSGIIVNSKWQVQNFLYFQYISTRYFYGDSITLYTSSVSSLAIINSVFFQNYLVYIELFLSNQFTSLLPCFVCLPASVQLLY